MTYPSDLNKGQWDLIKHHFDTGKYGTVRKHDRHSLINAVFYIAKTGCQWRFFGVSTMDLVKKSRVKMNRNALPSYSLIDSQSVKTTSQSEKDIL